MKHAWYLLPGALFGAGLALSGMTNPAKVAGFLDLFGRWDPSLALVMAGAMAAFFLGSRLLLGKREAPLLGGRFPSPPTGRPDLRLLFGATLFGIGWGLAGFCPGPAVVNLATARTDVLLFLLAMLLGMRAAQRFFAADSPT